MSRCHGPGPRGNILSARNGGRGSQPTIDRVHHRIADDSSSCSSIDLCIAWIVRARTESLCQIGRDLHWFIPPTQISLGVPKVGSGVEGLMTSCILVLSINQIFAFSTRSRSGMPPAPNFYVIYNCTVNDLGTAQPMGLD